MTEKMKSTVVRKSGSPWELQEVPIPKPEANQVLMKIHASGLCYTDVHITNGMLPDVNFPATLGHEPVGEIVEVGTGVRSRRVGDRVGVPWIQASCGRCEWCTREKPIFCLESIGTGIGIAGGHAEYMVAYADATILIPDNVSYEQAAPIFCAGYTVWSGLRIADPKPHEKIAVIGIGGLGHLGLQYSRATGFPTIAITRSKDKVELCKELGADTIVESGQDLLDHGGADVILATSNSWKATSDAMLGLRPEGRLVVMGLSGEALTLTPDLLMKRHRIIGSLQNGDEYLYEALDYVSQGKVKVMTETFPLDEMAKAYDKVSEGNVRFRAVLLP